MRIAIITLPSEINAVFPLMAQLRGRIRAETFVAEVQRHQKFGYILAGGFEDGRFEAGGFEDDQPVVLAGFREAHTLSRGSHLFVDDLVTDHRARGKGHGAAMMRWLARYAMERGLPRVFLDSRDSARGFYERLGFRFSTSIPALIDTAVLIDTQRHIS